MKDGLVLLDTNILVHLIRDNEIGRRLVKLLDLRQREERPLISVVTVGEIRSFARKLDWGTKKCERLDALLDELVVIDINSQEVLRNYVEIDGFLMREGRVVGQNDLWIAATAMAARAHLVTTDRDFDALYPRFLERTWIDPNRPDRLGSQQVEHTSTTG